MPCLIRSTHTGIHRQQVRKQLLLLRCRFWGYVFNIYLAAEAVTSAKVLFWVWVCLTIHIRKYIRVQ